MYHHMERRQPEGICFVTQGTEIRCSLTTQWGGKVWVVGERSERELMCVYLWLIHLMYS